MKLSDKHKEFIRLVANGSEQDKAYAATVGNNKVTKATARAKGSHLAKKYAIQIQQERERLQKVIQDAHDTDTVKNALKSVLTQAEVDARLCDIINGKLIDMQLLNNQGKVYKAQVTPTIADITKAIDLYNKRFGSNAPTKSEVTGADGQPFAAPIINILPKTDD